MDSKLDYDHPEVTSSMLLQSSILSLLDFLAIHGANGILFSTVMKLQRMADVMHASPPAILEPRQKKHVAIIRYIMEPSLLTKIRMT